MTTANQPVMGKVDPRRPAITQLLASIREDAARLNRILCHLNCDVAIRSIDGTTLLTIAQSSARRPDSEADRVRKRSTAGMMSASPALCAPIYDEQGRLFASLSLMTVEISRSETLTKLLRALIESAAQAITERFFRMSYRDFWIIAAQPHDAPDASVLLAVDYDRRLVGADRPARQFLEVKGRPFEYRASLSAVFKLDGASLPEGECDVAHRLLGCDDGVVYSVLITSPDRIPHQPPHDERVLLHARPPLDTNPWPGIKASRKGEAAGLPPRLFRRIQEYINTHLDCTLRNEELAASVGLSVSHFSRSFARSVGTTPHNYVVRRRLLRAQQLLAETDLALTEIALTTGFADQSHFSRRFLQLVGLQPKAFRKRHR